MTSLPPRPHSLHRGPSSLFHTHTHTHIHTHIHTSRRRAGRVYAVACVHWVGLNQLLLSLLLLCVLKSACVPMRMYV